MSKLLTITLLLFGLHSGACSDGGVRDTILTSAIESVNITSGSELAEDEPLTLSLEEDFFANSEVSPTAVIGGEAISYQWKMESGPGNAVFSDASTLNPSIAFDLDGDYVISLTISDASDSVSDEVRITYKGSKPEASVAGQPENLNAETSLDVTVSSTEDGYYYYKIIEGDSVGCSDQSGYSEQTALADKITDDFSALQDGEITLCVVSEDLYGNTQDLSAATNVSWIKSADAPFAVLTKTPDPETNKISFKVVVSGTDVTQYKFFFAEAAVADCEDTASYSAVNAVSSKINSLSVGLGSPIW